MRFIGIAVGFFEIIDLSLSLWLQKDLSCYHCLQTIVTFQFRRGGCDAKWLSFLWNFCMQDLSSVVVLHLHKSPQLQATTSNAASVTNCSISCNTVLQCSVRYESQDITDKFKTLHLPVRLRSTLDYVLLTNLQQLC